MDGLAKAKHCILAAKTIAISGHVNPDGDSIGSLLALGLGLELAGKKVYMLSRDGVPHRYRRLPGASRIVRKIDVPVDLAIAVDCSNKEILGRTFETFKSAGKILEIDHHSFRRPFGDILFIDKQAASVGEMIYVLLRKLGIRITNSVAQNIMTSIVIETGSFRLPSVRAFTLNVCADLINLGTNFYKLVDTVFWSRRKQSAILAGICLSRSKFLKGGRIAWSIIRNKDFNAVGGKDEDVDAIPDEMRAISKVDIAVLFRENGRNTLRVSLRSKNRINVAGIAEHYGGGGHFDVAGCTIPNNGRSIKELLGRAEKLLSREGGRSI